MYCSDKNLKNNKQRIKVKLGIRIKLKIVYPKIADQINK